MFLPFGLACPHRQRKAMLRRRSELATPSPALGLLACRPTIVQFNHSQFDGEGCRRSVFAAKNNVLLSPCSIVDSNSTFAIGAACSRSKLFSLRIHFVRGDTGMAERRPLGARVSVLLHPLLGFEAYPQLANARSSPDGARWRPEADYPRTRTQSPSSDASRWLAMLASVPRLGGSP